MNRWLNPADLAALGLSARSAFMAVVLDIPPALAMGWILARKEFCGRNLLNALVHIPMVLPPITIGFALLLIFGVNGPVGAVLDGLFGLRIAFTRIAVLMASMVAAFPLLVRSIRSAFELTDRSLEEASAVLGQDRFATWFRISLPLALPGIVGGVLLGFARAMGEFGATATFAGNIPGVTRTLPLAIWTALQIPGEEWHAGVLSLLSMVLAMTAFAASTLITPNHGGRR